MRPKETHPPVGVCLCAEAFVSLSSPSPLRCDTKPVLGSSISAGNVTAVATATNNFDIALQSCGANIAEHEPSAPDRMCKDIVKST